MLHNMQLHRLQRNGFAARDVSTRWGTMRTIHGVGAGGAPPIALLHGLSGRATVFTRVAMSLRTMTDQLLFPDLLGHGDSEVPDAGLTVDALQGSLDDLLLKMLPVGSIVVGVSMGGMLAIRHAARYPERLRGLVLCNPGGAPLEPTQLEHARTLLTPDNHQEARQLAQAGLASRSMLVQHLAALNLRRRLRQPHIRSFIDTISNKNSLQVNELKALPIPVRLLIGEEDGLLPAATTAWFESNLPPTGTAVRLPGVGHAPMVESPGVFVQQIRDFIDTL